ncbi:MAG TPA: hypothetical protein VFN96_01005, partial [Gemmatimonadales bacterium]|nr:hypothetical protein [Gemmatimonadales bacterium]
WTPASMDQLERAARDRRRVIVVRRGTEYIVEARRVLATGRREVLIGFLPMTGEELQFDLAEVDEFQVIA